MPSKLLLKYIFAPMFVLTGVTSLGWHMFSKPVRQPSSIPMSKLGTDQISPLFFDLQLSESKIPNSDIEGSSFTVTLTAVRNIPAGLTYTWNIPENVRLIAGAESGTLNALQPGESQTITLDLAGFSKETKKFLTLKVSGVLMQQNVSRDLMIASQMENTLEYKIYQQQLKNNSLNGKLSQRSKFSPENVVK